MREQSNWQGVMPMLTLVSLILSLLQRSNRSMEGMLEIMKYDPCNTAILLSACASMKLFVIHSICGVFEFLEK